MSFRPGLFIVFQIFFIFADFVCVCVCVLSIWLFSKSGVLSLPLGLMICLFLLLIPSIFDLYVLSSHYWFFPVTWIFNYYEISFFISNNTFCIKIYLVWFYQNYLFPSFCFNSFYILIFNSVYILIFKVRLFMFQFCLFKICFLILHESVYSHCNYWYI